jgi:hypothetical protein
LTALLIRIGIQLYALHPDSVFLDTNQPFKVSYTSSDETLKRIQNLASILADKDFA